MSLTAIANRRPAVYDDVLQALTWASPHISSRPEADRRIEVLLADFLACTHAKSNLDSTAFFQDGTSGRASALALAASLADLDDVDWRSLHHPGSVIWPVVVALSSEVKAGGPLLREAAWSGYATAATVADVLGGGHREWWHVTATAGAVGAAHAAGIMLGLTRDDQARAMALAASNAGGLALAARERRGASVFNRAAAVTLGVASARGAASGAVAVSDALGAMVQAMSAHSSTMGDVSLRDGILSAATRLYPVSGFLQSAVAAAAKSRRRTAGEVREIRLCLPSAVLTLTNVTTLGAWWDARLAVLRAWSWADPFACSTPSRIDSSDVVVSLEHADLPVGYSRLLVRTDVATDEVEMAAPPALGAPAHLEELQVKWQRILALDPHIPHQMACKALSAEGPDYRQHGQWWS